MRYDAVNVSDLVQRAAAGESLQSIGDSTGLGKNRVGHFIRKAGFSPAARWAATRHKLPCPLCDWLVDQTALTRHLKSHARFWSLVDKTDTCWWWRGPVAQWGYGVAGSSQEWYVHRLAYRWLVGEIPVGYEVDHLCRNKLCVNPDHLEAVTPAENRSRNSVVAGGLHQLTKTHCPKGHPYSGDNLVLTKKGRACRECRRVWNSRRRKVAIA